MRFIVFAAFAGLIWSAGVDTSRSWPVVLPFTHEWRIPDVGSTDKDTPVTAYINDVAGTAVYKLECHNGNYSDQSEINFSGAFQCALFAVKNGKNTSWNLLATKNEQDSDWDNRGRMLAEQLQGDCGSWPEFGTHRTFRLRGMMIRLIYKDLQWLGADKGGRLGAFTFEVHVQSDEKATAPETELIKTPKPPKNCLW